MKDTTEDLDAWRASTLEQWVDSRIVNAAWVDTVLWFFKHSYADFNQIGAELTKFSFRQKDGAWLLVVNVVQEGIPRVGFITSSNPTRCMFRLKKCLRDGDLKLYDDRYA